MTSYVVEADDEGDIHLPSAVLERVRPRARFAVTTRGDVIILKPLESPEPLWATARPQERADDLIRWVENYADGPGLPDDALRREHLYD